MKRFYPDIVLVLLMILGGFGLTYVFCSGCRINDSTFLKVGAFSSAIWISLWYGNSYMAHVLDRAISWTAHPIKRLVWGLAGTVLLTLAVLILLGSLFNTTTGISLMPDASVLYSTFAITFLISTFMHGRAFLLNWREAALKAESFRRESVIAQYDALKSQLNPHFLFNSLNALSNLVYEDQDKAARMIKQLSEVYRYVLDTREMELVSLQEELQFVKSYLFLQEIRFGDNLRVHINLDHGKGRMAPLALQLLLENAINHNIISRDNPLHIRVYREKDKVVVTNNLQRKTVPERAGTGLGLENIRRRYAFLSREELGVTETAETFTVSLPIIPAES